MTLIDQDLVKKIADSVRIEISDEEAETYAKQMTEILTYTEAMNEVNTDDVEPTTHGILLENVLRKDEPIQSFSQEEALKNAPDKQDGHFKVPSVMD